MQQESKADRHCAAVRSKAESPGQLGAREPKEVSDGLSASHSKCVTLTQANGEAKIIYPVTWVVFVIWNPLGVLVRCYMLQ